MKKRFLEELKKHLAQLNQEERNEIIRFYEERFDTGMRYEGKTEEEIVEELESPIQIARNVLSEYGYSFKTTKEPTENVDSSIKVGSLIGLVLFDIFLAAFLIPLMFSLFVGFGSGLLGFLGAMILWPFVEGNVVLSILLFAIGLSYLWFLLVIWLWDILIGFISWLIRWHLDVFRYTKSKQVTKTLRQLRVQTYIRRSPKLQRTKSFLAIISVFLIVGGFIGSAMQFSTIVEGADYSLVQESYDFSIDESKELTLVSNLNYANVTVRRGQVTEITVHVNYYEDDEIFVEFDEDNYRLSLTQETQTIRRIFSVGSFFRWFSSKPSIEVIVPEGFMFDVIDLDSSLGLVTLRDLQANSLNVKTHNGKVLVENMQVNGNLDIETTNGSITLQTVDSNEIKLKTTNGSIRLQNSNSMRYHLTTTNHNIIIRNLNTVDVPGNDLYAKTTNGNIDLEEVYVLDVTLQTTNGNIDYLNTDLTFILNRLSTSLTNGNRTINVPSKP